MDMTLDILKALQEQQTRNDSLTAAELDAACKEGAKAAFDGVGRGDPIWLMDEASPNRRQNAYAIGWNSEWAKAHAKG